MGSSIQSYQWITHAFHSCCFELYIFMFLEFWLQSMGPWFQGPTWCFHGTFIKRNKSKQTRGWSWICTKMTIWAWNLVCLKNKNDIQEHVKKCIIQKTIVATQVQKVITLEGVIRLAPNKNLQQYEGQPQKTIIRISRRMADALPTPWRT